jgi:hypothetical protein
LKKIVARAGTNLTLPCDAFNEKSISKIEKLTWKLSQTIIVKYIDGKALDHQQNQRVSQLYSLFLSHLHNLLNFHSLIHFQYHLTSLYYRDSWIRKILVYI